MDLVLEKMVSFSLPEVEGLERNVKGLPADETDRKVYHDDDECTEENNIEPRYHKDGTDGRPRCKNCQ